MKNLFGVINDYDEKKVKTNYEPFIIKKLTKSEINKISNLTKKYEDINQKTKPNKWLSTFNRLFLMLFVIAGLFMLVDFINKINKEEFSKIFMDNLFYFCAVIVGIIGFVISYIFLKKFSKSKEKINYEKEARKAFDEILAYSSKCLGITNDAPSIEILSAQAVIRKKQIKENNVFFNVLLSVTKNKDSLLLADLNSLIAIPLNEITTLEKIEEAYKFKSWHKKESIKDAKYEQYNIRIKGLNFSANHYYALKFKHNNEEYVIYIQPYDYPIIKSLIDLE